MRCWHYAEAQYFANGQWYVVPWCILWTEWC